MPLADNDRDIAHRYIVASLARLALERDVQALQGDNFPLKLAPVYAEWAACAVERVGREIGELKHKMKRAGLRVEADGASGEYRLYCGGREERAHFNGVILRNKVRAYLGLFGVNKNARS